MDDDNVIVEEEKEEEQTPEQLKEQLEASQKELEEKNEELEKLKEKETNFAKLRKKTAGKKEKIDEKENELDEKYKQLEERQTKWMEAQFNDTVEKHLDRVVGDDKELKEKVMFNYEHRLLDEVNTAEEAIKKIDSAYLLATGNKSEVNPLSAVSGISTGYTKPKQKNFAESEQGSSFVNEFMSQHGIKTDE